MKKKPNVLWICTDQQRFDTIASLGNTHIRTPNLDRLVGTGTSFTNAFCQCPVCTPSRASFLSGRYPSTTRVRQNGQQIPPNTLLVTRLFAEAGYTCGLSGKLHLGPCQGRSEQRIDDGYHEFHWSHGPWPKWPDNEYISWVNNQGAAWEEIYPYPEFGSRMFATHGTAPDAGYAWAGMPAGLHQSYWCAREAIEFIRRQDTTPWLFSVNFFDPHHPFDPPGEYLKRYVPEDMPPPRYREGELGNKPAFQQVDHRGAYGGRGISFADSTVEQRREITAAYYAMIENMDANVGRILDFLEETGRRSDTLVVFMSDHGEMLGDHGIYLKGPYLYDSLTRVPLILSWPAAFREGLNSSAFIELIDVAPTLLEAAGIPVPDGMQGRSFLEICAGRTAPGHHRDSVYCEYQNAMCEHTNPRPYLVSVRDTEFKVVAYAGMDGELYDLRNDPHETVNLWNNPDAQEIRARYLQKCVERQLLTADPSPPREAAF